MGSKWYWLIYPLALLIVIKTGLAAFSAPWTWTEDQLFFAFLMFCIAVGIGFWIAVWMRGGTAAVKARWAAREERMHRAFSGRAMSRNFIFWILLAVALVVFFNLTQH